MPRLNRARYGRDKYGQKKYGKSVEERAVSLRKSMRYNYKRRGRGLDELDS